MHGLFYGACLLLGIKIGNGFANHKISQHFFFFTKRKPVLKEKQIGFLVWSYKHKDCSVHLYNDRKL